MAQGTGLEIGQTIMQQSVVSPAMDNEMLKERFNQIQALKVSLLIYVKGAPEKSDIIDIVGKSYIKKSGWRKLAFAFNLSISIEKEWKEQWLSKDAEGKTTDETTYYFHVRVTAPNGRYVIGVACASTDEKDFAHAEHDPYALAYTRAVNRAISDILGLGEVSYDEMAGESEKRRRRPQESQAQPSSASVSPFKPSTVSVITGVPKPTHEVVPIEPATPKTPAPKAQEEPPQDEEVKEVKMPFKTIRMIQPLQPIIGDDGRTYGPFKAEDVISIPVPNAGSLIAKGYAVDIAVRQTTTAPEPATVLEKAPVQTQEKAEEPLEMPPELEEPQATAIIDIARHGVVWGKARLTGNGARLELDSPLDFRRADHQGLYNFFFSKSLGEVIAKVEDAGGRLGYEVEGNELDGASAVVLTGTINKEQLTTLASSMAWMCERAKAKVAGQG